MGNQKKMKHEAYDANDCVVLIFCTYNPAKDINGEKGKVIKAKIKGRDKS